MTWTDRADNTSCCGDDPGFVGDKESVARLLHSNIEVPATAAFTRKDLTWDGVKKPFDNTCGLADGCSVDRCSDLDQATIRARADAIAAMGVGRQGRGAIVASVASLREIKHESAPGGRAVLVYDDPMASNKEHAVLRVSDQIPRSDFDEVRVAIIAAFNETVAP